MIEARFTPIAFQDGEPLTINVTGLEKFSNRSVALILDFADAVETGWCASIPAQVDAQGNATIEFAGFGLGCETAVYLSSVESDDEREHLQECLIYICNPSVAISSEEDLANRHSALSQARNAFRTAPLGDPSAPGAIQHRVLCILDRVMTTTDLATGGSTIAPIIDAPAGDDTRSAIDDVLQGLQWSTRITPSEWSQRYRGAHPWTRILFHTVWAASMDDAAALAFDARGNTLAALTLSRRAMGVPVATVVEQRQPDNGTKFRVFVEGQIYAGNLAGGPIAGESSREFGHVYSVIAAEPLLRLCVDLYGQALNETSDDYKYFRLWSVLETLARARHQRTIAVKLMSGNEWPDRNHRTTKDSTPLVYRYLAHMLTSTHREESNSVAPAPDLYTALSAWNGRRNATAHYGTFDATDPRQRKRAWFPFAALTGPAARDLWLESFRHLVHNALVFEVNSRHAQNVI